jgi:hypothetical protein
MFHTNDRSKSHVWENILFHNGEPRALDRARILRI